MKVSEIEYKRVEVEQLVEAKKVFFAEVEQAESARDVIKARDKLIEAYKTFSTASSIANVRFTLNSRDEFYKAEIDYYDEVYPYVTEILKEYADYMLDGKYRKDLEKLLNPVLFKNWEIVRKQFSPETIEDMQEENAIRTEYAVLMSQMEFKHQGKKQPLSVVRGDLSNADRAIRKAAAIAIGEGLKANADKLDDIMDRLVKNRDKQAKKLGYKNFIELGYYRMGRIDYDAEMVKAFRDNVKKDLVPVVVDIKNSIARELGIDKIMFYDNDVYSVKGNPRPKIDEKGILDAAQTMYDSMHKELGKFYKSMIETEAFDVEARDGKFGGGYCTEFADYNQTFILANFNGSADDIDVVTHEFGHAFAMNNAMNNIDYEINIGSMETAECHSMSMEFFAWKYMDLFFENADEYKLRHLKDALSVIPYICMVDEFQHIIYDNPNYTPEERKAVWRKLETEYRPYMSTEGIPYLEEGTRWQYQMHIYETAFYYIDYALAQVVALSFMFAAQKDYSKALDNYIKFAKKGGSKLFSQLVKEAGFKSPFSDGALKELADGVKQVIANLQKVNN